MVNPCEQRCWPFIWCFLLWGEPVNVSSMGAKLHKSHVIWSTLFRLHHYCPQSLRSVNGCSCQLWILHHKQCSWWDNYSKCPKKRTPLLSLYKLKLSLFCLPFLSAFETINAGPRLNDFSCRCFVRLNLMPPKLYGKNRSCVDGVGRRGGGVKNKSKQRWRETKEMNAGATHGEGFITWKASVFKQRAACEQRKLYFCLLVAHRNSCLPNTLNSHWARLNLCNEP